MFKKAFWVPYEDSTNYPTLAKTMEAISKYCEENGESYTFINDDEVEINGKRYEIYRGYENGSRGNYGIKCKEKQFPVFHSLHIGSTCPELSQLNTRRLHSGTPSRKSEKVSCFFSAQGGVAKRHPISQSQEGGTRNALSTQRNFYCAAQPAAVCCCRRCLPERRKAVL